MTVGEKNRFSTVFLKKYFLVFEFNRFIESENMLNKHIFIFILFFSTFFSNLYGQRISGKVIDASNNKPVAGAKIELIAANKITTTNDSGLFFIQCSSSKKCLIKISCTGYNSTLINIHDSTKSDTIINVLLYASIEDIDEVVVTASRILQPIKSTPVLTQLVSANQPIRTGNFSVSSLLAREVAGLDMANFGFRPKLTFQGLNARYVLFLVDGERLAGEMDGDIDYYRLNLDNIDRIEIVRGPSSVLYGSNAISGVVNIITKKPIADFETNASLRLSKFNETSLSGYVGRKLNNYTSASSLSLNYTNGYDLTPDEPLTRTQEKLGNLALNQRFDFNISPNISAIVKGNIYYNRIYDGDLQAKPIDHAYFDYGALTRLTYSKNDSNHIIFSYANDRFVNYDVQIKRSDFHKKTASDFIQTARVQYDNKSLYGQFVTGIEVMHENIYSDKIINNKAKLTELNCYLQYEYALNKFFSIVSGGRFSTRFNANNSFVPKVSLVTRLGNWIFRTSAGKGFRAPTLKEMYYDFDHAGMFHLYGNENLKSEKSSYFSLSVEKRSKIYTCAINAYQNHVGDMIYHMLIADKAFQYININRARVSGIDFILKTKLFSNLQAGLNLALVNAINMDSDSALYNIAPISATYNLSYFTQINQKILVYFDLSDKYTGRRTFEPVEDIVYTDPPFHYWKFVTTVEYRRKYSIGLGIDNLFNKVMPNSLGNISPGRRFFLTFNYRLYRY